MDGAQLVLARYREDVSWAEELSAIVYNKGPELKTNLPCVRLENVGREAHTYLHHIVSNYDNLAEFTLFCQGSVSDHFEGYDPGRAMMEALAQAKQEYNELLKLMGAARPCSMTGALLLVGIKEWDERGRLRHHTKYLERYQSGEMRASGMTMMEYFREYVGMDPEQDQAIHYYLGAVFGVVREAILHRPKEYYERLLATVSWHRDPEEAYYLERAWVPIFLKRGDVCGAWRMGKPNPETGFLELID
jgi:hypothetical protein